MSYERWCAMRGFGARLAGDTSPTPQELAEAKRARKAAKRRRDAALTALGQRMSRAIAKDHAGGYLDARMVDRAIRRGEVVP